MKSAVGWTGAVCFAVLATVAGGAAPSGGAVPPEVGGRGLVAWVDGGQAEAAIEVGKRGQALVHVLTRQQRRADAIRQQAQAAGLAGIVTAQALVSWATLPFGERSVNAVVVDLPAGDATGPTRKEILRVLAPTGTAWLRTASGWAALRPPPDTDTDVWSHKWYDATGNAVSKDRRITVPNSLRWIAGPQSDVGARPQQGFRVNDGVAVVEWEFKNEGPRGRRQFLVARDAFSGTVLWTRDSGTLAEAEYLPTDPYKLVVLDGGVVYTVLRAGGHIVAMDAQTGQDLREYPQSLPVSPRVRWYLVVQKGRLIQTSGSEVRVLDAATGALKWSWTNPDAPPRPAADGAGRDSKAETWLDPRWQAGTIGWPVVSGDLKLVYLAVQTATVKPYRLAIPSRLPPFWTGRIVALDLETGQERWRHEMNGEALTQVAVWGPHLAFLEAGTLSGPANRKPVSFGVLDAATGVPRWKTVLPPGTASPVLGSGMMMALFNDRLWIATKSLSSYDLLTGKPLSSTAIPGNPTCTPPRLTTRTMVHPQGGYADLESQAMWQPRITRGSCGVEPSLAYGLQYFTPNRCTCSAFLRGHMALATETAAEPVADNARLDQGDAPVGAAPPAAPPRDAWPTFLANGRRWSTVPTTLPAQLALAWTIQPARPPPADSQLRRDWTLNNLYNGPVVGPVTDGDRLVVALPNEHAVQSRSAASGDLRWTVQAGGRIDTPPTLHGDRVYFGGRDGYVYALEAASGKLAWRFLAARTPQRMVAYGQVESKWPVHGAVLLHDGTLYAAAGYHPQVDGGITVWALDPRTGQPRWQHAVAHRLEAVQPLRKGDATRWPYPAADDTTFINQYNFHNLVRNDVLQSSGGLVVLPGYAVDAASGTFAAKFVAVEVASGFRQEVPVPHSYIWGATAALFMNHRLSDYGGPGEGKKIFLHVKCPATGGGQVLGSAVAVDDASVFAARDGADLVTITRYDGKGEGGGGGEPAEVWSHQVKGYRTAGVAATSDRVLVVLESLDPLDRRTGRLQVRRRDKGDLWQDLELPAAPSQNGLAVARGAVYVTLIDGRVLCFR